MERDFMGLNSNEPVLVIKEEAVEGGLDPMFSKGSAVHWPSSNKVSSLPHFMSVKVSQGEKLPRVASDTFVSPGFKAMRGGDAFDPCLKRLPEDIQNALSLRLHDVKMCPVSNQGVPISLNNPFLKTHFVGPAQNFVGANLKQQFLGGAPIATAHGAIPSGGSIARNTDWFNAKGSSAPAQLTIFYAGTVNVYNDISPEKAQAIMFLAGNGVSAVSSIAQPRAQVQAPNPKQAAGEGAFVNQPMITTSCSGLSSPMSVSSHPVGQAAGGFGNNDEINVAKSNGISIPPSNVEPPKMVTSMGSVTPSTMMSAVPQARKASLARFLEKRKERVMSSSPYNVGKKTAECPTPDSSGIGFSATSSVSSPLDQPRE